ncbi:FAD-dependent oxidoreductase [Haloferax sp. Atlit-12N]|uniref:NAD(P)/FAD-dependent oxidoreductase n=1 Tax=Haloferax sp. Atlit-12N TaxID=2077203 RepID=UPI000E25C3B6|nr:tryptophan 7-halogenase [Haloferax sp. Atlit-12N]RDZ63843.1 FAD-dependent oxidoreductase [Haloferax sp. Atlit-12N]
MERTGQTDSGDENRQHGRRDDRGNGESPTTDTYDVIIGGSGMSASLTAMILGKHGLDVVMLEAGSHPRFAVGEAMLPQSSMWMWILGEYHGIPEIQYLSDTNDIVDNVTSSCGIKHSIGFAYHEPGQSVATDHSHQLIPPSLPFYSESHLLRSEVDQYLVAAAERYGVEYLDETEITGVDIGQDEVAVTTDRGRIDATFYVDGTGGNSVLADEMGYREDAPELETDSRAIFTHVEGLAPFDELLDEAARPGQSNRLHDGTLHHVFDGGWMWIIPFDNFERSEANKASVGLVLDRTQYPTDESVSAEREARRVIAEFPDIERHVESATPVRPWVRTGRLQRTANQSAGHRHYLTNNTYGFVDPLYAVGLVNTLESVFVSTNLLLDAFEDDEFSATRFAPIDEMHRRQLATNDRVISNAYKSMGDFRLWNAWTQMWLGQVLFHDLYLQRHCFTYLASGQPAEFDSLLEEPTPGDGAPFVPEKAEIHRRMGEILDAYRADDASVDEAAGLLFAELRRADWLPKHVYDWGDERARHVDFSDPELVGKLIQWGKTESPEQLRAELFDFPVPEMA